MRSLVIAYLDTSAAMKLLVDEPESPALTAYLQEAVVDAKGDVVAGWLLHTELHCAARCHPDAVRADAVGQLLDAVILVDLTRGDLMTAGSLPWGLRSYDAIHLAVALCVGADAMIAYDGELLEASAAAGLVAVRPH
jgi:predicted nucleic acid-binding protein